MAKLVDRRRLDKMQRTFLYDIGCTDTQAFVEYNLAPPSLRRAVALLGFLHKRVLGHCHPTLIQAFPFDPDLRWTYHAMTLVSHFDEVRHFRHVYDNSIWQYVLIYNRLTPELVNTQSVSPFQSKLTHLARIRAQQGDESWREAFQSCGDVMKLH